ncbi:type 2 lanthipeptide synthetase LanM family protein [Anoxynatronum sibiricum]|uniref:Type 2 lanthipeptide synthetase LanM family protein n=1 Tax=Anoxynatronum sibiricum TaxID=210623 RepID=A0ABU9VW54_9CLOT
MRLTEAEMRKMALKARFIRERMNENETGKQRENLKNSRERLALWQKKAAARGSETSFHNRLKMDGLTWEEALRLAGEVETGNEEEEEEEEKDGEGEWPGELPPYMETVNRMLSGLSVLNPEEWKRESETFWQSHQKSRKDKVPDGNEDMDENSDRAENSDRDHQDIGREHPSVAAVQAQTGITVLYPLVRTLENQLKKSWGPDEGAFFSEKAVADCSRLLLDAFRKTCSATLTQCFKIFVLRRESMKYLRQMNDTQQIHCLHLFADHLLAGGWKEVFVEFPVLARLLAISAHHWITNMTALAAHYRQDLPQLEKTLNEGQPLGAIQRISGNLGDTHDRGKSVVVLTCESGRQLVYKPRNLLIDSCYTSLLDQLGTRGFPYTLKVPKTVNAGDHGWAQFMKHTSLASRGEAKAYYQRMGGWLALVYAMGGCDFHDENVIACGAHPVLIDLETVISHGVTIEPQSDQGMQGASVLNLGFLPIWLQESAESWVDRSSLNSSIRESVPVFNGRRELVFDHRQAFLEGFTKAYEFLMKEGSAAICQWAEETVRGKKVPVRFVMRKTWTYAQLQACLVSPRCLEDGFLYSAEAERLAAPYLLHSTVAEMTKNWPAFQAECRHLEAGDVPIFGGYADEKGLYDPHDCLVADYFTHTALQRAEQHMKGLNREDLERQTAYIQASLHIRNETTHTAGTAALQTNEKSVNQAASSENSSMGASMTFSMDSAVFREAAMNICHEWCRQMEKQGHDLSLSPSYHYHLRSQIIEIVPMRATLYDGWMGVALFMAACFRATGEKAAQTWALKLMNPFCEELKHAGLSAPLNRLPVGTAHGLGGMLLTLARVGEYLEDPTLFVAAETVVRGIPRESIKRSNTWDWFEGLAGLVHGLLVAAEVLPDGTTDELTDSCIERILWAKDQWWHPSTDKRMRQTTDREIPVLTMGMGARSGILQVLIRYNEKQNRPEVEEIIRQGVRAEAALLEELSTEKEAVPLSLCSGIAGMGLMWASLEKCGREEMKSIGRNNMNRIATMFDQYQPLQTNDLCCGNSGVAEWRLAADGSLETCRHLLHRHDTHLWNPSLFKGLTGIGYTLLRASEEKTIHSLFF